MKKCIYVWYLFSYFRPGFLERDSKNVLSPTHGPMFNDLSTSLYLPCYRRLWCKPRTCSGLNASGECCIASSNKGITTSNYNPKYRWTPAGQLEKQHMGSVFFAWRGRERGYQYPPSEIRPLRSFGTWGIEVGRLESLHVAAWKGRPT